MLASPLLHLLLHQLELQHLAIQAATIAAMRKTTITAKVTADAVPFSQTPLQTVLFLPRSQSGRSRPPAGGGNPSGGGGSSGGGGPPGGSGSSGGGAPSGGGSAPPPGPPPIDPYAAARAAGPPPTTMVRFNWCEHCLDPHNFDASLIRSPIHGLHAPMPWMYPCAETGSTLDYTVRASFFFVPKAHYIAAIPNKVLGTTDNYQCCPLLPEL